MSATTKNTNEEKKMKKSDLIRHFYNDREHGFTANVILNGCSNPTKKLKGLYNLAKADRVRHAQFDTYSVVIDGRQVSISELEKYA